MLCRELFEEPIRATKPNFYLELKMPFRTSLSFEPKLTPMTEL